MSEDISKILKNWKFDSKRNVRMIVGDDGKERIQVRLPLGIEQCDVDGRPDGKRPHKRKSFLDYYMEKLAKHKNKYGTPKGFTLMAEDCAKLIEEGILYYYRYVLFFQLKDYKRTIRDTNRNIKLFDFVKRYAVREEDKQYLGQYRPYIIRMNSSAKGLIQVEKEKYDDALRKIGDGIREIELLLHMENATFVFERKRSLAILEQMAREIRKMKPLDKKEELKRKLQEAIRTEEYERAAQLRDQLRKIKKP